jgi:hypothetical protein
VLALRRMCERQCAEVTQHRAQGASPHTPITHHKLVVGDAIAPLLVVVGVARWHHLQELLVRSCCCARHAC